MSSDLSFTTWTHYIMAKKYYYESDISGTYTERCPCKHGCILLLKNEAMINANYTLFAYKLHVTTMCDLLDANNNHVTHVQLEYVQLNRLARGEISAYREKCGESPNLQENRMKANGAAYLTADAMIARVNHEVR
jgi:hypothetical protein